MRQLGNPRVWVEMDGYDLRWPTALNQEANWQSTLLFLAQVRAAPPPPTQNHRRPAEKIEDVEITLVWWWVCPSVTATIKARLRAWPVLFLGTFAWWLLNRVKTRRIISDWVVWRTPPMFWIFCAFLLSFCMSSLTTAQILWALEAERGQPSCLPVVRFYMRLKTRPCSGHSHRITDHVHSYSILLWPQRCGRFSSFFKWLLLIWLSSNQIKLAT